MHLSVFSNSSANNVISFHGQDAVNDITLSSVFFISHEMHLFIMSISLGCVCQSMAVFGVATNILNIFVFIKQEFSETINISLLALSFSDLLSLIFMMWTNLCYTTGFRESVTIFNSEDVPLLTGSWPHVIFTRTTSWITAFISFERCLCVILPLKVKTVFTPKRHVTVMVSVFVVTLCCSSLTYVSGGLDWIFYPERNKTLFGLVYKLDDDGTILINSVNYAVNGVLMPVTSFMSVVICTVVLVVKLKQNAAWRKSNLCNVNQGVTMATNERGSMRNLRVAKMVVFLSFIFIACFMPAVIIFIAACVEPQLQYIGRYKNIFVVSMSISFTAEVINSSTNIFVYITMSTNYFKTFCAMLRLKHFQIG